MVDVATVRHELAIPPGVSFEQAKGFALWATRSILDGVGHDVIDVAGSNLHQLALE